MEAVAKTKYLKGSPQKARLVIDLVRGQNVSKALAILQYTNKRAAGPIAKCIRSAIANATYKAEQENIAIDPDDLWVKRCFVDMGPTKNRRRLRPAPQGRAYFERRHYCHITIELTSDVPEEEADKGPSEEQLARIAAKKAKKAAEQKKVADEKKAAGKAVEEAAPEEVKADEAPAKEEKTEAKSEDAEVGTDEAPDKEIEAKADVAVEEK
ncbi:MAG: 50S ribosomal protein L22, partial [Acidobacteriota bacterium]|nr:50S ribosomal protein L22 [Acidobacteriota bacterium]